MNGLKKTYFIHQDSKILDVDQGGFVFYPRSRGQSWSFHARKMADFLDKNFQLIFSDENNVA